ncbi:K(+)-transporting ATPase subunit C [Amnibacterium setariae]|uniref:Potassium-transporting ATPase KdpC subunit n=1 Tax=Amnibacterium setariae TaxID=2306585 RepID=A0A3A1U2J8_9MICO|nr:K(+)-transporting ATPase subunit C [Amnibacterium setariae]RIX30632.1 K(+)-transporting ATPase subunit C [Amnibacterium setariae]
MSSVISRGPVRTWSVALGLLVLTTVATIVFTAVVTLIGLVLPAQANGSLVTSGGRVVGSALIGQSFTDAKGDALPQWFQSRPSAAGDGYDGGASSGSNLGPDNPDLVKAIDERKAAIVRQDGPGAVPADAVTASGSGLDPHVSEAYALRQVDRVAQARGLSAARVRALVEQHVQAPDLGFLGEPTVNVLQLNIALAALAR